MIIIIFTSQKANLVYPPPKMNKCPLKLDHFERKGSLSRASCWFSGEYFLKKQPKHPNILSIIINHHHPHLMVPKQLSVFPFSCITKQKTNLGVIRPLFLHLTTSPFQVWSDEILTVPDGVLGKSTGWKGLKGIERGSHVT